MVLPQRLSSFSHCILAQFTKNGQFARSLDLLGAKSRFLRVDNQRPALTHQLAEFLGVD